MEKYSVDLVEKKNRSTHPLSKLFSNGLSGELLLPILLFGLLNRDGSKKGSIEEILSKGEMIKEAKPYFGNQHKEIIGKAESILDILYAFNRYTKGEYKNDDSYRQNYYHEENKPIKLLEVIRPHTKGDVRKKIENALTVNDRIHRLKNPSGVKRNTIDDFESITDILEILKSDKGSEVREVLSKAKDIMEVLRR